MGEPLAVVKVEPATNIVQVVVAMLACVAVGLLVRQVLLWMGIGIGDGYDLAWAVDAPVLAGFVFWLTRRRGGAADSLRMRSVNLWLAVTDDFLVLVDETHEEIRAVRHDGLRPLSMNGGRPTVRFLDRSTFVLTVIDDGRRRHEFAQIL